MKREKATLLEWLGVKRDIDFSEHNALGGFLGFLLGLFILSLVIISFAVLAMLVVTVFERGVIPSEKTSESIRNLGLLLAATVGLPFLVWRSIVAQKQVNVAEQGHITDRINEAVKGLGAEKIIKKIKRTPRYRKENGEWVFKDGNPVPALRPDGTPIVDEESFEESAPNLEVRIGGIYALERIALDSVRDHIQIMEILCAYVRENAALRTSKDEALDNSSLRIDLQAAISVIGRRAQTQIMAEWEREYRLDLRNTNLAGGDFNKGDFSAAMFDGCFLDNARFESTKLVGTSFKGATLNHSNFMLAELVGTSFVDATIEEAVGSIGDLRDNPQRLLDMPLAFSNLSGINLMGANISAVSVLDIKNTFGTRDTILSPNLEAQRREFYRLQMEIENIDKVKDRDKFEDLQQKINDSEFINWSSYSSNDLPVHSQYRDFLEARGMSGFPHFDS